MKKSSRRGTDNFGNPEKNHNNSKLATLEEEARLKRCTPRYNLKKYNEALEVCAWLKKEEGARLSTSLGAMWMLLNMVF